MNKNPWRGESHTMKTDEWFTPPYIVDALGKFDLDVCTSKKRPFTFAEHNFTKKENGLNQEWFGRVWCNPPYGYEAKKWLDKLSQYGNGICLLFARIETKMFFEYVWNNINANSVFFFKGRLSFYDIKGIERVNNGGAPSCLVAYGRRNANAIRLAWRKGDIVGKLIDLR
jgi:hypothetical protein